MFPNARWRNSLSNSRPSRWAIGHLLASCVIVAASLTSSSNAAEATGKQETRLIEAKKVDGKWRFVDDDGRVFALTALMGVARQDPTTRPNRKAWQGRMNSLLDSCGFVGLGSDNDPGALRMFARPYLLAVSSAPLRITRQRMAHAPQPAGPVVGGALGDPWGAPLDIWDDRRMAPFADMYRQRLILKIHLQGHYSNALH